MQLTIFKKDKLSQFDYVSTGEFFLALFLMFLTTLFSFIAVPFYLSKLLSSKVAFFSSHYFGIFVFFISSFLMFFIIYYFSCKRKNKTLKEGLFLHPVSQKIYLMCLIAGIVIPLVSLPVIFKFAPKEFYAMDIAKTKEGMIYLFTCALFAPVFEEIFYRGFVFPFLQSKLTSFWGIVLTSLFFGLSHFMNIGNAFVLLLLFVFYGFVLTFIRYKTNSLIPPIVVHFIHNITLIISFLITSGK